MESNSAPDSLYGFFDDLVRCETRLYNAVNEKLRIEHGIVASQFEFLRYFESHPGARVAEVAANFAAGVGAISKGIDRLEARGWVARHPHPTDGRSSLVSLTDAGAALVFEAKESFEALLAELVSSELAPRQREDVGAALATLRAALERGRIGLPVG